MKQILSLFSIFILRVSIFIFFLFLLFYYLKREQNKHSFPTLHVNFNVIISWNKNIEQKS